MVPHFSGSFSQEHYTKSEVLALFVEFLRDRALTQIDARIVREFCKLHGCAPLYYSYVVRIAKEAHLIRKVARGTASRWKVSAFALEGGRAYREPLAKLGKQHDPAQQD
jgi:hypothetical protein